MATSYSGQGIDEHLATSTRPLPPFESGRSAFTILQPALFPTGPPYPGSLSWLNNLLTDTELEALAEEDNTRAEVHSFSV